MKSTARPWSAMAKQGTHGVDRGKSLSTTSTGMKTSKSSTSLAFESRLSKVLTSRDYASIIALFQVKAWTLRLGVGSTTVLSIGRL